MRRLRGIDATFLYGETPRAHMHTLKIAFLDPSDSPAGYAFERVKAAMEQRIHRLPPFRKRLLWVPFGLHHPLWVDDPDFELDYHLRRMAVPAPGGMREVCQIISEIAEWPLDRERPLWELWMLEGLAGGRVAAVAKVHHALADGVASAELLEQFYDSAPGTGAESPEPPPYRPQRIPARWSLVWPAIRDVTALLRHGLPQILRLRREAKARLAGRGAEQAPPSAASVPLTPFSEAITPHRTFTCVGLSLEEVKQVKSALGVTINDVVLAITAGALRYYLQRRNRLPATPLVAQVPVSTRTDEEQGTYGNALGVMLIALHTEIADPVARLHACHAAAAISKAEFQATWGTRLENWVEYWPPVLIRAVGWMTNIAAKRGRVQQNLVVSNVPGPRQLLYAGATRVEQWFSVGPLAEGIGLNLTVWSYVDQLNFSLLSCREAVPDLWEITDRLADELKLLQIAAGTGPAAIEHSVSSAGQLEPVMAGAGAAYPQQIV